MIILKENSKVRDINEIEKRLTEKSGHTVIIIPYGLELETILKEDSKPKLEIINDKQEVVLSLEDE